MHNIKLNDGDCYATAYGCDLTYDYVEINAEYTT
ncbi:bifunctional ornithine acetyltransferase/N-acetylglutamate synthase [Methanosphaera cuniculi]